METLDAEYRREIEAWDERRLERWQRGDPIPADDPKPTREAIHERREYEKRKAQGLILNRDELVELAVAQYEQEG